MAHGVEKVLVTVSVDGELVNQEVYVDSATGLDVDPHTGVFRTRAETENLISDVYRIGRDALPKELERYNKWMMMGFPGDALRTLPQRPCTSARKVGSTASSMGNIVDTEEFRVRGNDAMRFGDIRRALSHYTEALRQKPSESTLWSNRAAALIQLGRGDAALSDAEKAVSLDSTNVKAYYRKASALLLLGMRAAAHRCVNQAEALFGPDVGWGILKKRIGAMPTALLVGDKWVCIEDVEEGTELCALEVLRLPGKNASEVLQKWAKDGVPPAALEKEALYYSARGSAPVFDTCKAVVGLQKLYDATLGIDAALGAANAAGLRSSDVLRWSCILFATEDLQAAAGTGQWSETIFADGCIVLGLSLFRCPTLSEENVTLCFDSASQLLRVVARQDIKRYETLLSASDICC